MGARPRPPRGWGGTGGTRAPPPLSTATPEPPTNSQPPPVGVRRNTTTPTPRRTRRGQRRGGVETAGRRVPGGCLSLLFLLAPYCRQRKVRNVQKQKRGASLPNSSEGPSKTKRTLPPNGC